MQRWLRSQGWYCKHSSISVIFIRIVVFNPLKVALKVFVWLTKDIVWFTWAGSLAVSLESMGALSILSIIFNVSGTGCRSLWPDIVSATVRLSERLLRMIILGMHVWTLGRCSCCWCGGCSGSGSDSWLLTSERTFCIATFERLYAIMMTQCTFIIIFNQKDKLK